MLKNLSVLLVEDDLDIRSIMKEYLETFVETIYVAKDGIEGLNKFYEYKPDIIISDLNMPNLNGMEMSKKIKNDSQNTFIILATAYNDNNFIQNARDIGIDKYLIKPIEFNIIKDILEGQI